MSFKQWVYEYYCYNINNFVWVGFVLLWSMYCNEYDRLLRTQEANRVQNLADERRSAGGTDKEIVDRGGSWSPPAWGWTTVQKWLLHQEQSMIDIVPETTKGRTSGKRRWNGPECKIGIKDSGTRRQPHLKIERRSEGLERKPFRLQVMRRAVGMSSRLRKVRDRTMWRVRPPPKRGNR
jgi:hypothetical protein